MTCFGPWIRLSDYLAYCHDEIGERTAVVCKRQGRAYLMTDFSSCFQDGTSFGTMEDAMRVFDEWTYEVDAYICGEEP